MTDRPFHSAWCRLMLFCNRRIQNFCNGIQHFHIIHRKYDRISEILIPFDVRRYSDLMNHIRHICFQISFGICNLILSRRVGAPDLSCFSFSHSPDMFDPVQQHLVVKGFQHIIICSKAERIFCNPFLSHRRNNNKCRKFFAGIVVMDPLHDRKAIYLWHNNIQHHHIRFLFLNNAAYFFPVMCFSDQLQVFILFDHSTKYFYHFFVIICNCHIQLLHEALLLLTYFCFLVLSHIKDIIVERVC